MGYIEPVLKYRSKSLTINRTESGSFRDVLVQKNGDNTMDKYTCKLQCRYHYKKLTEPVIHTSKWTKMCDEQHRYYSERNTVRLHR